MSTVINSVLVRDTFGFSKDVNISNQDVVVNNFLSDAHIIRFANKLHKQYHEFSVEFNAVLERNNAKSITFKRHSKEFYNFLNQASLALQTLEARLEESNELLYHKVSKLIKYLHKELDVMRIMTSQLMYKKIGLKRGFSDLTKQLEQRSKF